MRRPRNARRWVRPEFLLLGAIFVFPAAVLPSSAVEAIRRAAVDESTVATLQGANDILLEVQARPRDSYVSLAMRYAGSERHWAAIERENERRPVRPGLFYAIPFDMLTFSHRARAVAALFPSDGPGDGGWVHRVPEGDEGQRLESVALWFTGDRSLADDLAESNGVAWAPLPAGTEIVIPEGLLLPAFESAMTLETPQAPPPVAAAPEPPPTAPRKPEAPEQVGDLLYLEDDTGRYGVYRLKKGEALYSAVVVRFTGRLDPEEVSQVARDIARGSGVRDVTSIPIGHPIRIPRDLILPEFLPTEDPVRIAYESDLAAADRHHLTVKARDLEGVSIILDAGHGGDDIGAQRNGVHEDDYVYDIMCRIKKLAEATTAAKVFVTIKDESSGFEPQDGPFRIDRDEVILTSPPYAPRKPHAVTVGVNLRWYLVNSHFRTLTGGGADPQRIVFVSIHADSLHPAVRGAMVYVPGQSYRQRTYGHVGRLYDRREVGELRYVKFGARDRERSEGLSRSLAERIIAQFRSAGLPVHDNKPIRDHVIRGRRRYTPAVIRTSLVPQSLLLEVVNLNNRQDAALIKDPAFRERVARTFLDALVAHYGTGGGSARPAAARSPR